MDADARGGSPDLKEEDDKVLIIGAGCTGLAVAQGLKKAGIPAVVYESRSNVPQKRDWNFGLHWSAPALQSLVPAELWDRLQTAQVDPHTPTKDVDTLRFHDGSTGELMKGIVIEKFHRLRHSKLQALLSEGLDIYWERTLVDIAYSPDGKRVKAIFKDGTEATGSILVGADGPRSSVRSLLVGPDRAKRTPIDFATTICFTTYSREQALFLRSAPHHPLFQAAPHPDGNYTWFGLHDASDADRPETWVFWQYISYPEPRDFINTDTTAQHVARQKEMGARFADPWKSSFDWMPGDLKTAWYNKLTHWDPALREHEWDNRGGRVTLAGDAAHPMTFQRGQGLNHAIFDSMTLCGAITDAWRGRGGGGEKEEEEEDEGFLSKRKKAIGGYEGEMIKRASEEVRLGEMNSNMLHDWEQVLQSPVFGKGVGR